MKGFVGKDRATCSAQTDQQNPATLKWITVVEFNCDISEEGTLSDHFMVCLKLYGLILSNYVVALTLWVSGESGTYCYFDLIGL